MIRKSDDDERERGRERRTKLVVCCIVVSHFLAYCKQAVNVSAEKKTIAQVTGKEKRKREREEKRERHVDERKLELNTCGHFCPEKITLSMSFLL